MIAVGVAAVLTLRLPLSIRDISDFMHGRHVAGLLIPLVLPLAGTAWLLVKSRRILLAGPVYDDTDGRRSRTGRERYDDWRLDA
jgi:hypothetical protein